jgi:hypothetical protein
MQHAKKQDAVYCVCCMFASTCLTIYDKNRTINDSTLAEQIEQRGMSMMRLKVEESVKSLHPSEATVVVKTIDGAQRLVVSRRSIQNGSIQVGWPLGENDKAVLGRVHK